MFLNILQLLNRFVPLQNRQYAILCLKVHLRIFAYPPVENKRVLKNPHTMCCALYLINQISHFVFQQAPHPILKVNATHEIPVNFP